MWAKIYQVQHGKCKTGMRRDGEEIWGDARAREREGGSAYEGQGCGPRFTESSVGSV